MPDGTWAVLERNIRERVAQQGFMAYMGAVIESLAPGSCAIGLPSRPQLMQQMGYLHGGCLAFLADNAATLAAATYLRGGQAVLTADLHVNFLAPARGEKAIARGRVIKPGRTLTVSAADIYMLSEGTETHVATALATIAIVSRPESAIGSS
jgi:uncharacterized protein (TIGR00369 family)